MCPVPLRDIECVIWGHVFIYLCDVCGRDVLGRWLLKVPSLPSRNVLRRGIPTCLWQLPLWVLLARWGHNGHLYTVPSRESVPQHDCRADSLPCRHILSSLVDQLPQLCAGNLLSKWGIRMFALSSWSVLCWGHGVCTWYRQLCE